MAVRSRTDPTEGRGRTAPADLHEERLVRDGLPVLREEARRLWRRLGCRVELDELEAMAHPALVELARAYDDGRGSFAPFAARRLRWAMLDALRRQTHGRVTAGRARALAASELLPDLPAAAAEPSEPLGGDDADRARGALRATLRDHAGALAVALVAAHGDLESVRDGGASPEELAMRHAAAGLLRRAVDELPERERMLVEQHYFAEERFDHIAAALGITKSWASRLHARALRLLASRLRDAGAGAA